MDMKIVEKTINQLKYIENPEILKACYKNGFDNPNIILLSALKNVTDAFKNLEMKLKENNMKEIELKMKYLIHECTTLLNDDLSKIIKLIFNKDISCKINKDLKKIRKEYLDMPDNLRKHNQNRICLFEKINKKKKLLGFYLTEIKPFDGYPLILPNSKIHKKHKNSYTGFSFNYFKGKLIHIIIKSINTLYHEINNFYELKEINKIKKNNYEWGLNILKNITIENYYFINEVEKEELFYISGDNIIKRKKGFCFNYEKIKITNIINTEHHYALPYFNK